MRSSIKELESLGYKSATDYCRDLIAEGTVDPKEPLEVWRGEIISYTISSIEEGAKICFKENPSPHFEKYYPPDVQRELFFKSRKPFKA